MIQLQLPLLHSGQDSCRGRLFQHMLLTAQGSAIAYNQQQQQQHQPLELQQKRHLQLQATMLLQTANLQTLPAQQWLDTAQVSSSLLPQPPQGQQARR